MRKITVLCEGADLDALSAAFAVQKLYKDCYLLQPKYLSKRAGMAFREFKHLFRVVDSLPEEFVLILVDSRYFPSDIPKEKVKDIVVYDHHPFGDIEEFEGVVERVGAATTLVVEKLRRKGISLSPEEATLIALGIYEDTGSFTYEGTTPRDTEAVSWLLSQGANLRTLRKYILETFTKEQIDIVRNILSSVEKIYINGKEIAVATAVLEKYDPDINALLYEVKDLKEADAFFIIIEAQNKTYVFGRSQTEDIDVGEILSAFGGGGHRAAGAVKLENVSSSRIKSLLISQIKGLSPPKLKVGEIMSSPAFLLSAYLSVKDALAELSERGFANAPVIDREGNLIGIVSKKALIKLSKLYPEESIGEFVNKDYTVLKPDSPVWEAEEILTRFGQKLIPVIDKGIVVGVVTRLDILQKMKEDLGQLKAYRKRVKIPTSVEDIVRCIGETAQKMNYRVYIVGGVVRDILLGKEVWDLDFVVEGDAIEIAQRLSDLWKIDFHPFPEFGTVHMKKEKIKLEFSTARRETYPKPGAYPKVEKASLKEDLIRRDFTINAMAISVNPEDFGTLLDYFGGVRDLKDKIIRILHPVSFIEDPVRILRALRFEGRLGFKLSKSTERLLKQAVNLGLLEEAPRGRILAEIRLALREDRLIEILSLYRKYRVLEHVIKGFRWNAHLEDKLLKLKKVTDWHSLEFPQERVDYGWIFLMLILSTVKYEVSVEFLKGVSAPAWVRENTARIYRDLEFFKKGLKSAQKNSQVYKLLKGVHISLLLLLMIEQDIRDKIKVFLEKLRYVKVPTEKVEELKSQGIEGRKLGMEIEKIKLDMMDQEKSFIMEK